MNVDFNFDYSSEKSPGYFRKQQLVCSLNIMEGLKLVNFEILPADNNASLASLLTTSHIAFPLKSMDLDKDLKSGFLQNIFYYFFFQLNI